MEEKIWHFNTDFEKKPAKEVLKSLIEDDKKNYKRAELELKNEIVLLDDAITLYLKTLQAAYIFKDKWKNNNSNRTAIAMLASTFNYILLIRHGILMGYYPEIQDLLRSCYERMSRCLLFFTNVKYANMFLSGKEIKPRLVDRELSKLEKDITKANVFHQHLRKYYGYLSEFAHPNLKSFTLRNGSKNIKQTVGVSCIFGGIQSASFGYAAISRILQTVLSALKILSVILPEESGEWKKEFQRISEKSNEMYNTLSNKTKNIS